MSNNYRDSNENWFYNPKNDGILQHSDYERISSKIGISQQAISKWKINNSITAIKKNAEN